MNEMTPRERFAAVMNFRPFDRLPIIEWAGWWDQTLRRWRSEGLPAGLEGADIYRHLGMDIHYQDWIWCEGPGFPWPQHGQSVITSEADYERLRPRLYHWPVVKRERWQRWAELQARGEVVLWLTLEGFFWFPRQLLGIEPHMYAFYDMPGLMHRINADLSEWMLRVIDEVCSICTPDFMTFAEDMSYNHGPMISQEIFREFLLPYYQRVIPALRQRGTIPIVDSDGDITTAAPWFEAAGIEGILPLERQAGVDVAALRRTHPTMRFIGCFDKMTMNQGEPAMRAEFERLLPVAAQGGLIISVDHQTPPGVSLEDYRLYLRLFREYAAAAGRLSQRVPRKPGHPVSEW